MHLCKCDNGGLGEWDFSSILSDIGKTWAQVEQAKTARDIAKLQAQNATLNPYYYAYNPNQSPIYSSGGAVKSGFDMGTLLVIGAVGIAAYLLLRK